MGLRNMALHGSITTPAVLGGTALALVGAPVAIQNGLQLVCSTDTNFQTRKAVTCKSRPPSYDAKTKKWTKQKNSMSVVIPTIDSSDSSIVYNTGRLEVEFHPSVDTSVIVPQILAYLTSFIKDANTQPFLNLGTVD